MKRSTQFVSILALLGVLVSVSCVTEQTVAPGWISTVPTAPDDDVYLVAYGRGASPGGAESRALDDAALQLAARYAAVAAPEGDAGDFLLDVATERITARRRDPGSSVFEEDRFSRRIDETYEVYLLFRLDAALVQADARDIARAVVIPAEPPSTGVNRQTLLPLQRVRYDLAMLGEGAAGAVSPEDIVRQARRVSLDVVPDDLEYRLGALEELRVTVRLETDAPERLVVVYPKSYSRSGTPIEHTRVVVGVETQTVRIVPPERVGEHRLIVEPEFLRDALTAASADGANDAVLDAVRTALQREITVLASSSAATVPTAVVVVDADIVQNPISTDQTSGAIVRRLAGEAFDVQRAELAQEQQERILEARRIVASDVYEMLPFELLAAVDRAIVGKAWIVDFQEDDGYLVRVSLEASVLDLRSDRNLLDVTVSGSARGNDSRGSIRAAFQAAGEKLAAEVVSLLP